MKLSEINETLKTLISIVNCHSDVIPHKIKMNAVEKITKLINSIKIDEDGK